jgi:hypothetical protein
MQISNRKLLTQNRLFYLILTFISLLFFFTFRGLILGREIFTHDAINWFGIFDYYADCLLNGYFPFWDPYMLSGTPFYPNVHLLGLLDPLALAAVFLIKVLGISHLTAFIWFYLFRLFLFVLGAYFLFKYICGCSISALISSGVLLFAVAPICFWQNGMINSVFLTPFALLSLILFIRNIETPRRYLYLTWLVLITGITLNVYIPVYFLFNIIIFFLILVLLKLVAYRALFKGFKNKKFLFFSVILLLLLIIMAGPSLVLMHKDSSGTGELFPSIRLFQKNNFVHKKILATEMDDSMFSGKFTNFTGVYSSYGNMLNLVYPDIWQGYFLSSGVYNKKNEYISEMGQYIGIIPFLLCIIGFIYSKSRYRHAAIIVSVIICTNMISFYGVHGVLPNFLQKIFNQVFPPLKMIEVRELFSPFFLLYLCILLCLGLRVFFNKFVVRKIYFRIIAICFFIFLLKVIFTNIFFSRLVFTSPVDMIVISLIITFAALIYFHAKGILSARFFYVIVFLVMFCDLAYYDFSLKKYVLQKDTISHLLSMRNDRNASVSRLTKTITGNVQSADFEYFRQPSFAMPDMPFIDTIMRTKGHLSSGHNHIFTTKRYYDILTHVPIINQFYISGMVRPIISYYTADRAIWKEKEDILSFFVQADLDELNKFVFLEKEDIVNYQLGTPIDFKELGDFDDVEGLDLRSIDRLYSRFTQSNKTKIMKIPTSISKHLKTSDYEIEVRNFSPNKLELSARNRKDGYLVYNDGWSRYWKVYDNGQEVPVYPADYNGKAVFLEKGEHTILFVFDPAHYRMALWGYYAGLMTCLVMIAFFGFRSHRLSLQASNGI